MEDSSNSDSSIDHNLNTSLPPRQNDRIPKRISSRRAIFARLEALDELRYRERYPQHWPTSTSGSSKAEAVQNKEEISRSDPALIFSPSITLSPDPDISPHPKRRSDEGRADTPPSHNFTPSTGHSTSPNCASLATEPDATITLLSPRPIIGNSWSETSGGSTPSGSPLQPDTHAEAIVCIMWVFQCVNPQYQYHTAASHILITLYLILSGNQNRTEREPAPSTRSPVSPPVAEANTEWIEEEVFWAYNALMADLGDFVFYTGETPHNMQWALVRLTNRIRWADDELWSKLHQRDLEPSTPLYANRWLSSLLAGDLPSRDVMHLWDVILSEPPQTVTSPRLDTLIDVCTAMLIHFKRFLVDSCSGQGKVRNAHTARRDLWSDSIDPNITCPSPGSEDTQRLLSLLRSYPVQEAGGIPHVLRTAHKIRQARMVAGLSGDDPDDLGGSTWTFDRIQQAKGHSERLLTSSAHNMRASTENVRHAFGSNYLNIVAKAKHYSSALGSTGAVQTVLGRTRADQTDQASAIRRDSDSSEKVPGDATSPTQQNRPMLRALTLQGVGSPADEPNGLGNQRRSSTISSRNATPSIQERLAGVTSGSNLSQSLSRDAPKRSSLKGPRPLLLIGSARRVSSNGQSSGEERTVRSIPLSESPVILHHQTLKHPITSIPVGN